MDILKCGGHTPWEDAIYRGEKSRAYVVTTNFFHIFCQKKKQKKLRKKERKETIETEAVVGWWNLMRSHLEVNY